MTDLALEDRVVFVDIPKHRRFRCHRCGGGDVTVAADWPNPIEAQQRRMGA